jgi:hypothetical protein
MQQRSADRPDLPVGEATARIPLDTPASATTAPGDATTIIPTGDRTLGIPVIPGNSSATRVLPAPVIVTAAAAPVPATPVPATPTPAAGATRADHRPEFAVTGIVAAVLGVAGLIVPNDHARLVLLLVFMVLGPGAAVLAVANVGNRLMSWALSVIGSMTIALGAGVLTLWTHLWQPDATLSVLAGGTVLVSIVQLVRLTRAGVPLILGRVGPPWDTVDNGVVLAAIPFVTLASAVALWIVALVRTDPQNVSLYGISATLGVPFIVGVVLLMTGFAVELFGRARPLVLGSVLLVVPVMMQATVPLLDGTIEYAWTYKHIGVIDLLRDNGHLLSSSDIYQQWPGFFAVLAMLSHAARVDALSFAAWSSLFFALANSLMTAALLRQFTSDRRIIALAVLVTQAAMWVDIGYFSPQAYVYTLMLGFWIIVTRWLMGPPESADPTGRIGRLRAWLVRGMPAGLPTDRRTRIWAALAAAAVFAAITAAHQLTPFMMLVPIIVFAVLGVLRPRLLAVGLTAIVIAFVAPRLGSVSSQYSIFSLDFLSNASGNADNWRTTEQEFSAAVARSLAIGLWLIALAGVFLARKRLGRILVPAALGFLPMSTLIAGNYGGEAIYRVFAFSLPLIALLISTMWVGRKRRGLPSMLASGVMLTVLMLAGLQGLQGQLYFDQVRATDIEAAQYFYANAQPDSGLVLVAPNFPTKLSGNYGSFNRGHVSVDYSLVGDPLFTGTLSASRVTDVETYIRALKYTTNYLVVSDAMADYTDYFGTEPAGTMAALDTALRASPDWTVFYQASGVTIFQLKTAG